MRRRAAVFVNKRPDWSLCYRHHPSLSLYRLPANQAPFPRLLIIQLLWRCDTANETTLELDHSPGVDTRMADHDVSVDGDGKDCK